MSSCVQMRGSLIGQADSSPIPTIMVTVSNYSEAPDRPHVPCVPCTAVCPVHMWSFGQTRSKLHTVLSTVGGGGKDMNLQMYCGSTEIITMNMN